MLGLSFLVCVASIDENSYLFAGRSMDANVISALNDTISARNEYKFLETKKDQGLIGLGQKWGTRT